MDPALTDVPVDLSGDGLSGEENGIKAWVILSQ